MAKLQLEQKNGSSGVEWGRGRGGDFFLSCLLIVHSGMSPQAASFPPRGPDMISLLQT